MKNTLSNKLKFLKLLERIHKLKVELLNTGYHSSVNDIDERANHLYDMFLNGGLSDKEKVVADLIKQERSVKKVKDKYKKKEDKIKLKEWKLNKERKKVGYLKHRAKIDFKVKKKLKEKFGDTFFSNMKKDIKDPILTNNKFLLNGLKKT
tara:strand:+ start:31 stop:480 length:450 start_codon:yes stop_codon:yes gene_type:complete